MRSTLGIIGLAGGVILSLGALPQAHADSEFIGAQPNFVGQSPGMGPKCPPISFHVVAKNKTDLLGAAFATGESGMELYNVSGGLKPNGEVSLELKPVGVGTAKTIEGTYKLGMLMVKMSGGECHVDEFMMMPVTPPGPQPRDWGRG